nr:twin-arginine translocase TatA/TatE family subunit [uncultured Sphingomonas sp.]
MGGFSLIHWIILGVLLLLLFGGNRFSNMMGDVAKGLKSFKEGLADEDKPNSQQPPRQLPPQNQAPQQPIDITPRPAEPTTPPPADDQNR